MAAMVLSAALVRVARSVALRRNLFDHPNLRSSHRVPTPRLGGVAFVPVMLLATIGLAAAGHILTTLPVVVLASAAALYVVSLIDDLSSLSTITRSGAHLVIAGVMTTALYLIDKKISTGTIIHDGIILLCLLFWIVGMINGYNFMDGIDGMAGAQAVVAGVSWIWIGRVADSNIVVIIGAVTAAVSLGFLTLNWSPAKIFMGDAGSTVFGVIFAALPLIFHASDRENDFLACGTAGALVVWPFIADTGFTLVRRAKNRENIFQAHRSHLYQRLVIAGKSHREVTLTYAGLAATGGIAAGLLVADKISLVGALVVPIAGFWALWRWTLACERLMVIGSCDAPKVVFKVEQI